MTTTDAAAMTRPTSLRRSWIGLAVVHGLGLFTLIAAALSL